MGMEEKYYLGSYLEAKNKIKEINRYGKFCCDTNYKDLDTFCKKCGKLLEKKIIGSDKESIIDKWELSEKIDENLSHVDFAGKTNLSENIDIWIPNYKGYCFVEILNDNEGAVTISGKDALNIINKFYKDFKKEIDIFIKEYGEKNIEIKFGLICYYR